MAEQARTTYLGAHSQGGLEPHPVIWVCNGELEAEVGSRTRGCEPLDTSQYHRSITEAISDGRGNDQKQEKPAVAGLLGIAGAGFEPATFGL
jgi:hypothetical protein